MHAERMDDMAIHIRYGAYVYESRVAWVARHSIAGGTQPTRKTGDKWPNGGVANMRRHGIGSWGKSGGGCRPYSRSQFKSEYARELVYEPIRWKGG